MASDERSYRQGRISVFRDFLRQAISGLDGTDSEAAHAAWIIERSEIVAQLRDVCDSFGDNDWLDSLHLGDVIEKHLARHLFTREPRS